MPKMKSKSSAKKRFSFTATGKIKRQRANHRHNMTHQSRALKRDQRQGGLVDPVDAPMVRRMLPYGGK
jgi:large subunit ribosomal protein L35